VGVQGHRIRKRLCWLRAKLRRTVSLWHAVIAEARTCYGARKPDLTEWRELEVQMMRQLSQDERFWEGAVGDVTDDGVMICSGENERLQASIAQMQRFKRVALDGKSGRFEAEKHLAEWHAGAAERARDKQVYGEERRARQVRRRQVGYTDDLSSSEEEERETYSTIVARRGLVMDKTRLRGPHCYHEKNAMICVEDYHDGQEDSIEECYDLCYDNVSNGGATRLSEGRSKILYGDLEYDERMRQRYFSGSKYANVTDFSNVH
jgi:hypothetical protein